MLKILNSSNETLGYYDNIYGKLYTNNYEIITTEIDHEESNVSNHVNCKNMIFTFDNKPSYRCTNSNLYKETNSSEISNFDRFIENLIAYLDNNPEIMHLDLYGSDISNNIKYIETFVNMFRNKNIRIFTDISKFPNIERFIKYPHLEFHISGNNIPAHIESLLKSHPYKFWISIDISKLYSTLSEYYSYLSSLYPKHTYPIIEYIDVTKSDIDIESIRKDIKNFCIYENGLNRCDMFARIANRLFSPKLDIKDCSTNHCFLYQIKPHVCTFNGELVRCPNYTTKTDLGKDQNNYLGELSPKTTYRKFSDNHWVCDRDEFKYIDKCLDCEVKSFCNFCDLDTSIESDNICCAKTKIIYGGVLDAIISMQFEDNNFKLEEA